MLLSGLHADCDQIAMLCCGDRNLHAGLAVAGEAADEVVGASGQRDAVLAGSVDPGAPGSRAAIVAGRAHRHHVVNRRVVVEHCRRSVSTISNNAKISMHAAGQPSLTEHIAGPEALPPGPAGDVEGPSAVAADDVGGGLGHLTVDEETQQGQPQSHDTAPSLSHHNPPAQKPRPTLPNKCSGGEDLVCEAPRRGGGRLFIGVGVRVGEEWAPPRLIEGWQLSITRPKIWTGEESSLGKHSTADDVKSLAYFHDCFNSLGGSAILRRRVSSMARKKSWAVYGRWFAGDVCDVWYFGQGSYHLENNAPSPGNMEASGWDTSGVTWHNHRPILNLVIAMQFRRTRHHTCAVSSICCLHPHSACHSFHTTFFPYTGRTFRSYSCHQNNSLVTLILRRQNTRAKKAEYKVCTPTKTRFTVSQIVERRAKGRFLLFGHCHWSSFLARSAFPTRKVLFGSSRRWLSFLHNSQLLNLSSGVGKVSFIIIRCIVTFSSGF